MAKRLLCHSEMALENSLMPDLRQCTSAVGLMESGTHARAFQAGSASTDGLALHFLVFWRGPRGRSRQPSTALGKLMPEQLQRNNHSFVCFCQFSE